MPLSAFWIKCTICQGNFNYDQSTILTQYVYFYISMTYAYCNNIDRKTLCWNTHIEEDAGWVLGSRVGQVICYMILCDFDMSKGFDWFVVQKKKGSFPSRFWSRVLIYSKSIFSSEDIFFPAGPCIQEQYILCDETNSSSINDSKRDVAPEWVDLSFSALVYRTETIMAAFGWMKARKKRLLKIFIATDIYFHTVCL